MRIGVDLGGTKIEAVVMNERSSLVVRERVATPQGDYRETLEAVRGAGAAPRGGRRAPEPAGGCRPSGHDLAVHLSEH